MSSFTDNQGRQWTLDINLDSIEQVRAATNVSIYELSNDKARPLAELLGHLPGLAHVCYILAGAEAAGVEQRDFAKSIKGPEFEAMSTAFCEELTLFFQGPRQAAIKLILDGAKAMQRKATEKLKDVNVEEWADLAITQIGLTMSGDLSALSASSPARPAS